LFLVTGILAALHERSTSGLGQVVDGAIADGVASLCATTFGMVAAGNWGPRGSNMFDGSLPYYSVYRTRDNLFVAVGAIEPAFYEELLHGVGLDPLEWPQHDAARCADLKRELELRFQSHDRAYWEQRFFHSDACVSPVLSFSESFNHPHHQARGTYVDVGVVKQQVPGPRLSRTPFVIAGPSPERGEHTEEILNELQRP
jgi:alpha-methylacyl-CoA racemase